MVKTRLGIGGPQPVEVTRMLARVQANLSVDKGWMQKNRQNLKDADAKLDMVFNQLLGDCAK